MQESLKLHPDGSYLESCQQLLVKVETLKQEKHVFLLSERKASFESLAWFTRPADIRNEILISLQPCSQECGATSVQAQKQHKQLHLPWNLVHLITYTTAKWK